ncbi:MAG: transcription antitermination protein [Enterococcus sp.]
MITKNKIELGKKYEVKPESFHRPLIGTAIDVTELGVLFTIDYCELCDKEKARSNEGVVVASFNDVKRQLQTTYFFS